jgi:hypothetical protein
MTVIVDAKGRQIEVARVDTLTRRRFTRAMGRAADSDRWFGEAILAIHARMVDGVPIPMPLDPDQADALVARLDAEGINAVAEWLGEQNNEAAQAAVADAAKNSPGTLTS